MGLRTLLLGSVVTLAVAEPVDLAIILPPKAVIEYRLETSERTNGGPWEKTTARYHVEVTAIDEAHFETRWRDMDTPTDPPLVFRTDEALVPATIVNRDALLDSMANMAEADDPGGKDHVDVLTIFREMSNEALTALVAKDLILTSYGQGTYLVPGEINRYQQPGGTFGDGEPLLMNASFLLESVKPEAGNAVVVWASEIDPDVARKALPGIIGDLMGLADLDDPAMESKMAAVMATARLQQRTECRYQIDIETGLAARSECEDLQDIQADGESQRRERRLVATQRLIP